MKKSTLFTFLILILGGIGFPSSGVRANGLGLRNLSWNQADQTVSFEIRWFNSWRVSTGMKNWDAAWVFVKFRECGVLANIPWNHGLLSTTLGDHTFPAQLEPVTSDGSTVGIELAPNNTGVLLRPTATDTLIDTLGWYPVTLKVTNLPTTGSYDIKVFGIEMVYIPRDSFYLGGLEGDQGHSSQGAFCFTNDPLNGYQIPHPPVKITSENATTVSWYYNENRNLSASYPKGYKAFHVMKYEISEGQYRDFLNTLSNVAASARFPGYYTSFRNQLTDVGPPPHKYLSVREDRAQNWLSMQDLMGYLDWAALRPITELEFEKICRGPENAVNNQYPWGTDNAPVSGTTFNIVPEDGTELFTNTDANCTFANVTFSGGDGGKGPTRVGIHVKPGQHDRIASGLSYYGVPDMAGNLYELVVTANQVNYDGHWGDGLPDGGTGLHNEATWPANATTSSFGYRGGSFISDWRDCRISSRVSCIYDKNATLRKEYHGGRGAR